LGDRLSRLSRLIIGNFSKFLFISLSGTFAISHGLYSIMEKNRILAF
jgi:hypothetical protein